ncbi:hypothetical protein TELCIR_22048 [Teladorsagia circumcincta]|uniref:Uncharacterized protein n=1 Tax=Teladorsagia circumcincta TaxID=45464 RepID=A0A2G9TGA3_TELCI|nr:hypothetical protein TELCIR_22048 [Teladorsagia circumcincta]
MSDTNTTSTAGVTGGLLGAIRRTSDAFVQTLHVVAHPLEPYKEPALPPVVTAADTQHQVGRRVSDVDHLWQTAEKVEDGF